MLFNSGEFTLHSGAKTSFFIDCDALTDQDLDAIAAVIAYNVGPFREVHGIPRGGLRLAEAVKKHAEPNEKLHIRRPLIVDDVCTTGASFEKARTELNWPTARGVCIFARGEMPYWVSAVFEMSMLRKPVNGVGRR